MGHLHCGFSDVEVEFDDMKLFNYRVDEQRAELVKVLDLFVGIPSVILEPDNKRKELYGKAGAFRPKSYGLEYRTVSNFYLVNTSLRKWAFESVVNAFRFFNEKGKLANNLAKYIEETINNNDKVAAGELIKEFNLQLV